METPIYTYSQYCEDLEYFQYLDSQDMLNEGFISTLGAIKGKIGKFILDAKKEFKSILDENDISIASLIKAFKDRDFFSLLKFFKFSLKTCFQSINKATQMMHGGMLKAFQELHKDSKLFARIRQGGADLDAFLNKYPILKKITGIAVAGILLYLWLNMTFIGDLDYDMDISAMFGALRGNFSIETLFLTPEGNMLLALFVTGFASSGLISFAWLGGSLYNLVLAVTYVLFKRNGKDPSIVSNMRKKIKI